MPLGSEAADHEIVNGNETEAESAGLSGRGADGVASAGAIPTTSAKQQRTSNAGSRAFNVPPPLGPTAYDAEPVLPTATLIPVGVDVTRSPLRPVAVTVRVAVSAGGVTVRVAVR